MTDFAKQLRLLFTKTQRMAEAGRRLAALRASKRTTKPPVSLPPKTAPLK